MKMNKVVIITGASKGIGRATAEYLINKGCTVYGISRKGVEDLPFTNYLCDVNNLQGMKQIVNEIFEKEGRIDVFVNNAGFGIAGAIEETKPENVTNIINTNLTAVINLCSLVIPYLKQSGGGNIVNISSVGGIVALPFQACYSASKAGVETFSKALALEVKPFNIKVTAILPGDTKTNFTEARIVDQSKDQVNDKRVSRSVGRMAKDEQNGKSPVSVAKVVYKVLKKKNPPLRKSVGFVSKLEVLLVKLLPTKFVNFIVNIIYG